MARITGCMGLILAIGLTTPASADSPIRIDPPKDGDAYSKLVARAEAGDQTVDFRALRSAWLESAAVKRAGRSTDNLRKQMRTQVQANNPPQVRDLAIKILTIDYTDMSAHKFLRQSCVILKDVDCAEHFHFTEFGLLNSVTRGKTGKSTNDAFEALAVPEEYFVIDMMGARPQQQSVIQAGGRAFDRMDVVDQNGAKVTYYFDITEMMAREAKALGL